MNHLLNISDAASLALHAMTYLAWKAERATTHEIADILGASENHLSKVFQRLGRSGLVASVRGPGGGFLLVRPPNEISLSEVFEAIEGPFPMPACLLSTPICNGDHCILGGTLNKVNQIFRDHMENHNLADMASVYRTLKENAS